MVDATSDLVADVSADGTVRISGFHLPMSQYMSEQGRRILTYRMQHPFPSVTDISPGPAIERLRATYNATLYEHQLARVRAHYDVDIRAHEIGGITTDVITPRSGVPQANGTRVLVNLHGGGFLVGARLGGQIESAPIAALGGFRVITVDYREAPEHTFPAASEDVASVYRELLKQYDAKNIGIYGISAGGFLTAQAVAWFQEHRLPVPGAIGIFSAGAGLAGTGGDSIRMAPAAAPVLERSAPPAGTVAPPDESAWVSPYFGAADLTDRRISPELYPDLIAGFPPTMLAAGGRDWLLSRTINSHRLLINAGVDAHLHVWEGMWHGWNYEADIPESREFYARTARFFDKHLGRGAEGPGPTANHGGSPA